MDNLTLLLILQKWGQRIYNPEPKDIVHFDVIEQLLKALRQWPSQVRLVTIGPSQDQKPYRLSPE